MKCQIERKARQTSAAGERSRTFAAREAAAPNSVLAAAYEMENQGLSDLGSSILSRLPGNLQPQIPAAENEADRLSAGIAAGGQEDVKQELGSRLGADFSKVRFHTGAGAAAYADHVGARAYTTNSDVYFGTGGFAPSVAGHELVHTVQQGAVSSDGGVAESAPPGGMQMRPLRGKKAGPAAAPPVKAKTDPRRKGGESEDLGLARLFQEEPEASKGGWMHRLKEAAGRGASRVGGTFHSVGSSIAHSAGKKLSSMKRKNEHIVDAFNNFRSDYAHMSMWDRFLWSVKNPIARLTAEHRKEGTKQRNIKNARIESLAEQYRKDHIKSVMAASSMKTGTAAKETGDNHLLKRISNTGSDALTLAQHLDSADGKSLGWMSPGLKIAENGANAAMEGAGAVSAAYRKHMMESRVRAYEERIKKGEKLSKNDLKMLRIARQGTGTATADLTQHTATAVGSGLKAFGKAAAVSGVGTGVGMAAAFLGKGISALGGAAAAAERKEDRRQVVEHELKLDKRKERLRRAHPELTEQDAKHVVLKAFQFPSGKMKEAADFFTAEQAGYLMQQAKNGDAAAASMLSVLGNAPEQIAKNLGSTGRKTYDNKNPFAKKRKPVIKKV
jgi:hypothetical protein